MKKLLDYALAGVLFAIPCITVMTSCSDDETAYERKKTVINDANAGEFSVTNISYSGTEDGLSLSALKGDTLKIIFIPKAEYKEFVFEKHYNGLEQINDSLYRVKDDKAGRHDYELKIVCQKETDTSVVDVSAEAILKVNIPEAYVIIPYIIGMTDHLQELVTPEVTYTDADGNSHTFTVRDEDLTMQTNDDITTYFYTFNVRYYKTGITSSVSVTYIPRPDIKLGRERYYLYHSLRTGSADVHIPGLVYVDLSTSFGISIVLGGEDGVAKNDVPAALEELKNTPDVLRLDIFKDNGIKEVQMTGDRYLSRIKQDLTGLHIGNIWESYPTFDSSDASDGRSYNNYVFSRTPLTENLMEQYCKRINSNIDACMVHEDIPAELLPILYYNGDSDWVILASERPKKKWFWIFK